MTDPYTPTTGQADEYTPTEEQLRDQLEDVWLPKIDGKHNSEGWLDRFLAARDRAVREAALEEAAQIAESSTNPAGFGHGSLNEGSRSQWYAHGKRDSAAAIRALPIPSTGADR